jgi:hypothetical protein
MLLILLVLRLSSKHKIIALLGHIRNEKELVVHHLEFVEDLHKNKKKFEIYLLPTGNLLRIQPGPGNMRKACRKVFWEGYRHGGPLRMKCVPMSAACFTLPCMAGPKVLIQSSRPSRFGLSCMCIVRLRRKR